MNKTLIVLGHSSYQGTNARRLCFSKAQAIRVLRNRGCTRDEARAQLARESDERTRKGAVHIGQHDYVECSVYVNKLPYGWQTSSFEQLRAGWKNASEL